MTASVTTPGKATSMHRIRGIGIKFKTLLLLGVLMSIIVSTTVALFLNTVKTEREDNLTASLDFLASIQSDALSTPLWNFDSAEISKILKTCLKDPNLVQVAVFDNNNKLVERVQGHNEATAEDMYISKTIGNEVGTLKMSISTKNLRDEIRKLTWMGIGALTILLIITLGAGYFSLSLITSPLNRLKNNVEDIAGGNLNVSVSSLDRKDEIGSMANAIFILKENITASEKFKAEKELEKNKARLMKKQEMDELAQSFQDSIQSSWKASLDMAENMLLSASSLLDSVQHTKEKCSTVSHLSSVASHNVSNVAGAIEQLSVTGKEITDQARDSAAKLDEVSSNIKKSNTSARKLVDTTKGIQDIVSLINSVATQTNLLALNATIEAARAGEHGRGFTIVASEVKELSKQTASATQNIQRQLQNVDEIADEVANNMLSVGEMVEKINDIILITLTAIREQGQAIHQIASNIAESAKCTEETKFNSENMLKSAADSETVVKEVVDSVSSLEHYMMKMQTEINNFLVRITTN